MSHEIPSQSISNPQIDIDINRPYLVPRGTGKIEVWHVMKDKDGKPLYDLEGNVKLQGQHAEMTDEGLSIPTKSAHPEALTDKVQGYYADKLAESRPFAEDEEFNRVGAEIDSSAEAITDTDISDALQSSLEPLGAMSEAITEEVSRSKKFDQRITELANEWRHMSYGGMVDTTQVEQLLYEVYAIQSSNLTSEQTTLDLKLSVDKVAQELEEAKRKTIAYIEQTPDAEPALPSAVKRACDSAPDLTASINNASERNQQIDDQLLKLVLNMTRLLEDSSGSVVYMTQIRQVFEKFETDPSYARAVPYLRAKDFADSLSKIKASLDAE